MLITDDWIYQLYVSSYLFPLQVFYATWLLFGFDIFWKKNFAWLDHLAVYKSSAVVYRASKRFGIGLYFIRF